MTDPRRRTPRGARAGRVRVALTARDKAILAAVARFRLCRSSDLARLYFSTASKERCAQRLRRLFRAGFLDVRVEQLAEQNLYSLGIAGRAWAKERGLSLGHVPSGRVGHHLAVVRVWSHLAAAISGDLRVRLRRVRPDWVMREAATGSVVVPDLLVELAADGARLTAAVEVDLGTERSRAWRDKLARYAAVQADRDALLAVVTSGASRASIAAVAKQVWRGPVVVVPESSWPEGFIGVVTGLLTDPSHSKKGEEAASA